MNTRQMRCANDFNSDKMQFQDTPYVTPQNARFISMLYNNTPLIFQTPVLQCPNGFKLFTASPQQPSTRSYPLLVSIPSNETNFIELINKVDDTVLNTIMMRSEAWFNKKYANRDLLNELIDRTIKYKKTYPPSMNLRLKHDKHGKQMFGVFDNMHKYVSFNTIHDLIDLLPKQVSVQCIVQCNLIWYVNNRIGFSWDILQLKICESNTFNANQFVLNYMFIDDDVNEEQKEIEDETKEEDLEDDDSIHFAF